MQKVRMICGFSIKEQGMIQNGNRKTLCLCFDFQHHLSNKNIMRILSPFECQSCKSLHFICSKVLAPGSLKNCSGVWGNSSCPQILLRPLVSRGAPHEFLPPHFCPNHISFFFPQARPLSQNLTSSGRTSESMTLCDPLCPIIQKIHPQHLHVLFNFFKLQNIHIILYLCLGTLSQPLGKILIRSIRQIPSTRLFTSSIQDLPPTPTPAP